MKERYSKFQQPRFAPGLLVALLLLLLALSNAALADFIKATPLVPTGTATVPVTLTVTTGAATNITPNGATVQGEVYRNGLAASYYFDYGPSADLGNQTTTISAGSGVTGVLVSATLTHLNSNTVYSYRLVGISTSGTTFGAISTLTTEGAPQVKPSASVSSTVQGTVIWGSVKPDGLPTTVYFNYGTTLAYSGKTANQAAGSGTNWASYSAIVTGLKSETVYHYRIVAANRSGTANGLDQTFTTPASAPIISSPTVINIGESVASLNARVDPQDGASAVFFHYGVTSAYGETTGTTLLNASESASDTSANLSGLTAHTVYHIQCVAQNAEGKSTSKDNTFKTLPRFDMIGNGYSDLLLSDASGDTTLISFGSATQTSGTLAVTGSAAGPTLPSGTTFAGEAEFDPNQDGGTIIGWVLANGTPGQTVFLTPESGGTWASTPVATGTFPDLPNSQLAGVADIDGDGNPDLVLVNSTNAISYWLLNGFTVVAQKSGPVLPANYQIVGLDSLASNGQLNILAWDSSTGSTKILTLNHGTLASTTAGPAIPVSGGWQLVGINVYTGTGAPKWLLYNTSTSATEAWNVQGAKKVSSVWGPAIPPNLTLLPTQ